MAGKTFGEDPAGVIAEVLQQHGSESKPPTEEEENLVDVILSRMKAPQGSPSAEVQRRFPQYGEFHTLDITPGGSYDALMESVQGQQGYPPDISERVNPAGFEAFLERAPESSNIEDRRGEPIDRVIADVLRDWVRNRR